MQRRRAYADQYYQAGLQWNPLSLGSACAAWWNADDLLASVADLSPVATWKSRTGSNNAAISVTASGTTQPTFQAKGWTWSAFPKPAVLFDGVANVMAVAPVVAPIPTGVFASNIYVVCCNPSTSTAGYKCIVRYGSGTGTETERLVYINNDARQSPLIGDGTVNVIGTTTTPILTNPVIVDGSWSGTIESGRMNGAYFTPTASATIATLATGTAKLAIGANNVGTVTQWFPGPIRHVIITTLLQIWDQQRLEGWLAWDSWPNGPASPLPANHPYKNVRVA